MARSLDRIVASDGEMNILTEMTYSDSRIELRNSQNCISDWYRKMQFEKC